MALMVNNQKPCGRFIFVHIQQASGHARFCQSTALDAVKARVMREIIPRPSGLSGPPSYKDFAPPLWAMPEHVPLGELMSSSVPQSMIRTQYISLEPWQLTQPGCVAWGPYQGEGGGGGAI